MSHLARSVNPRIGRPFLRRLDGPLPEIGLGSALACGVVGRAEARANEGAPLRSYGLRVAAFRLRPMDASSGLSASTD